MNDEEQWKNEEILNKTENRKEIWYKIKWLGWDSEYNQWLSEKEFDRAQNLIDEFNERASKRRKKIEKLHRKFPSEIPEIIFVNEAKIFCNEFFQTIT